MPLVCSAQGLRTVCCGGSAQFAGDDGQLGHDATHDVSPLHWRSALLAVEALLQLHEAVALTAARKADCQDITCVR